MSALRTSDARTEAADCYLYGLVAAGGPPPSAAGVGGRPVVVRPLEGCGALVSAGVDRDAFGLPDDLLAHTRVLDAVAATRTVVPVAFGTFLPEEPGDEAVRDLSRAFRAAVDRVDGAVQLTLTARYRQEVVLGELVREDREIARLQQQTAGTPEQAMRSAKLRLGELVVQGLDRKAEVDGSRILAALRPLARETAVRERREADEVVELAALVERDRVPEFEEACDRVAAGLADRATCRLLGPQAPYDFVRGR